MPETQGKSINIFDDDTWDELTGKRILRDLASPLTAAGLDPADATATRITEVAGVHAAKRFARSVLPPPPCVGGFSGTRTVQHE